MSDVPDPDGRPIRPGADTSDPLAALSPRGLRALARRAARVRRDAGKLDALAAALAIDERRLRLLADAWREGGSAGVDALGPAVRTPMEIGAHADAAVERWRARHYPLELLRCELWRNRVTIWRLLAGADRRDQPDEVPLLQLRVTHAGRWHLYRRTTQGEWWPVTVRGSTRPQTIEECLEAVRTDPGGRFWSTVSARRPDRPPQPAPPPEGGPGGRPL